MFKEFEASGNGKKYVISQHFLTQWKYINEAGQNGQVAAQYAQS